MNYLGRLTDASINSLNVQGGPMKVAEIETFETNPGQGLLTVPDQLSDPVRDYIDFGPGRPI